MRDGVLTIKNVTDADDGIYICTATNSFVHKGQQQKSDIIVERRLRVKSKLKKVMTHKYRQAAHQNRT